MGIRETINQRQSISIAVVSVIVVIAAVTTTWTFRDEVVAGVDQVFFSNDDGKTFFADDASKIPPFEHDGKTAYLAGVSQFEGSVPFVAYLIRYTPEAKAKLEEFSDSVRNSSDPRVNEIKLAGRQIKRPGETQWIGAESTTFEEYLEPQRPKGASGIAKRLQPE